VDGFDRREFLERVGRLTVAAGTLGAVPGRAGWLPANAQDRRLRELARELDGSVVAPGSAAYPKARLLVNTRFDRVRPRAIVFCETVQDVERTVRWARKYGIHIVARGGGHSYGGYSTTSGVVVDLSRMSRIRVDAARKVAVVGAGARLIDVYSALWRHGLTIPAGSCPTVGIAGLTLGGGVGYSSRKLGLTCDNLRRLHLVTASGAAIVCDANEHADLFWASRGGGGGNFGIATDFSFRARTVGDVSTYSIEWPWAEAVEAVRAWQAFAPHAPDGLFSVCDLLATDRSTPNARAHVVSGGQFFGSEQELRSLIQPLVDTGTPIRVNTATMSYMNAVLKWAGCSGSVDACHLSPRGTLGRETFKGASDYVARPLQPPAVATLVHRIELLQETLGRGAVLMDAYGGAINRVHKGATAFVHRKALFSCQYVASWNPGENAGPHLNWVRRTRTAMRPYVSGFAYQNYIDPDVVDWKRAYYGSNYRRLAVIKQRHDPGNVFRFGQSIPPH
jgi:FAD/FMN-containing dehydrogenase